MVRQKCRERGGRRAQCDGMSSRECSASIPARTVVRMYINNSLSSHLDLDTTECECELQSRRPHRLKHSPHHLHSMTVHSFIRDFMTASRANLQLYLLLFCGNTFTKLISI